MSYGSALLLGIFLACAAMLFAYLAGKIGESMVEGRPEVKWVEAALPRRSLIESKFDLRLADLRARIGERQAELGNLRRRRYALEKELVDARREADSPIRVVGREGTTDRLYRAWVINRQVQASLGEAKSHPTLDVEWATPQIVEIWADTLTDARRELQRVYPLPLGFSILNIKVDTIPGVLAAGALTDDPAPAAAAPASRVPA